MSRRLLAGPIGLAGAAGLRASFAARPGSPRFYALTGQVALTWLLGGALLHGRRPRLPRVRASTIGSAAALGAGAFALFHLGALVARHIPVLRSALEHVLRYADRESPLVLATTLANGVAEEVFFRGALYDAAGAHPVASSTVAYVLVTSAAGNPALVLASSVMGTLFALQRKHTGSIVAPVVTHLVWSTLMLTFLDRTPVSGRDPGGRSDG